VLVSVNGESRDVPDDTTVAVLLEQLQLNVRHVAVEVNRELVPRAAHCEHVLQHGDELEIVTLVGGG
jgi:thiamine biosynthesis protein ThiS